MCNIEPGDMGVYCNGDKKHCCFHWEPNDELNSDLKQSYYNYGTIKGVISNFRIIFFHSFSFFLQIKIPPMSPGSILHRSYMFLGLFLLKHLYNQHMLFKCSAEFYIKRLTNLSLIETLIINDKKGIKE